MAEEEKKIVEIGGFPGHEHTHLTELPTTPAEMTQTVGGVEWTVLEGNKEGPDSIQVNADSKEPPVTLLRLFQSEDPKRLVDEGETFEEYRHRRAYNKQQQKQRLRGKDFFIAKIQRGPDDKSVGKTYNREEELKKINQKYGNSNKDSNNGGTVLSPILNPDKAS